MTSQWLTFAMLAITLQIFALLVYAALKRILAVRNNQLHYKVVQNLDYHQMPEDILLAGRSYDNQFQQPILFLLLLSMLQIENTSILWVIAAWCFIALRFWHAFEHISAKNIKRRTYAFGLSSLVLLTMWLTFLIGQLM